MTTIINLFGGPGSGKSTTAAGVFSALKQQGYLIEYVSEYAKDVTYEGTLALLSNQLHIFSEQFRRQFRLLDQVDWVITDSPILLSSVYFKHYLEKTKFAGFTKEYQKNIIDFFDNTFSEFKNINVYIERNKPYVKIGRNQTEEEAIEIDKIIFEKLHSSKKYKLDLVTNSQNAVEDVVDLVKLWSEHN